MKIICLFASLTLFAGEQVTWMPAHATDMVPDDVIAMPAQQNPLNAETQPVSMALPTTASLEAPAPFIARSREYHTSFSAADLVGGVTLVTTDPGALVRIHAVNRDIDAVNQNAAIDPSRLVLVTERDQVFERGSGFELLVTAEQLAQTDNPFPEGTSVFRLKRELGAGQFWLYADGLERNESEWYMMHVLEKESATIASLQATQFEYLAGGKLTLIGALETERGFWSASQIQGQLIAPTGETFPVSAFARGGQLTISGQIPQITTTQGLWEVELDITGSLGGMAVRRNVRTAFGVGIATARLNGQVSVNNGDDKTPRIVLGVQVGTPARYEARGVLYGTNEHGELQAFSVLDSAAVLQAGTSNLAWPIDLNMAAEAKLEAPFAVRDVMLINQDNMQVMQRMAMGFAISRL
ncbi:MAG: DUF4785 family protein [Acidobacteria bacterium]|nr:DUF4785 family protein [Acidobacteriota bacterium]